jgi:hypothetical protein
MVDTAVHVDIQQNLSERIAFVTVKGVDDRMRAPRAAKKFMAQDLNTFTIDKAQRCPRAILRCFLLWHDVR